MTRQTFYCGRNSPRNSRAKFQFVKLFLFAESHPRWRGKNFESAKMRTKRHYRAVSATAATRAIRIKQRCRRAFLSPWRTIEQNKFSDVSAAANGWTNCDQRNYRSTSKTSLRRCRTDGLVRYKGGRATSLQDGNHQCSPQIPLARASPTRRRTISERNKTESRARASLVARYFRNYLRDKLQPWASRNSSFWHFEWAREKDRVTVVRPLPRDGSPLLEATRTKIERLMRRN